MHPKKLAQQKLNTVSFRRLITYCADEYIKLFHQDYEASRLVHLSEEMTEYMHASPSTLATVAERHALYQNTQRQFERMPWVFINQHWPGCKVERDMIVLDFRTSTFDGLVPSDFHSFIADLGDVCNRYLNDELLPWDNMAPILKHAPILHGLDEYAKIENLEYACNLLGDLLEFYAQRQWGWNPDNTRYYKTQAIR